MGDEQHDSEQDGAVCAVWRLRDVYIRSGGIRGLAVRKLRVYGTWGPLQAGVLVLRWTNGSSAIAVQGRIQSLGVVRGRHRAH